MQTLHRKTALLIAGALTFHACTTWAAVCSVPTLAYPTIQSAVDDSTCTTINVAPGVYTENVSISRSLTLNGAQAGQMVAARISGGPAESTLQGADPTGSTPVILINAPNVIVDGFTIKNTVTANAAIGIDIKAISNDALIQYNIFDGINTLEVGPTGTAQAIFLESGPLRVEIGQNRIQNVTGSQAARAIFIGDGDAVNLTSTVFIHDNMITGITSTLGGAYGLLVATTAPTSAVGFIANDVSNLEGATLVHGVSLETDTPDVFVYINNFTNLIGPATDNVAVWFANNPSTFAPGTAVQGNNFNLTIMSYGIGIGPGLTPINEPFDGRCNWWGSADGPGPVGPGSGARVSPDVAYSPWGTAPGVGPVVFCSGNNVPTTEADCKNGGWTRTVHADGTPFKNQGDCVQYVNNGH
jgi:hypothetical protein